MTTYLGQQSDIEVNDFETQPSKYLRQRQMLDERRSQILGKEFETEDYGKCTVVEYNGRQGIIVMFHNPQALIKTRMSHLKSGKVKNTYYPSLYGKGFMGEGLYSSKDTRAYRLWSDMIKRGYDEVFKLKYPSYKDVTVCEQWYNFQNFAEWCYKQDFFNAKDEKGKSYQLDKDLLIKGNKVYSPETCCFIPHEINSLILNNTSRRGDCPVGVYFNKRNRMYCARVCKGSSKMRYIGYYSDPIEAFYSYKKAKESYIKEVAEKWKGGIEDKVYQSLINYEVEFHQ